MKKINTSPISGFQELLPEKQIVFNNFKRQIEDVYKHHGFFEIETPTIDRTEILFAKAGGDTEKQIYRVFKTEETADVADQALRFDHTVPLARYVSEHQNDLTFPFKVTQIGRNFRGERAQKGRFREFYQCDIDIVGRGSLAIEYDAEVILTLFEAYGRLGLNSRIIRVSNRKILSGFLEELNLEGVSKEIFKIIDHAEKVSPAATKSALSELNVGEEKAERILTFIEISGTNQEVREKLLAFNFSNAKFLEGIEELSSVLSILEDQGLTGKVIADMKIVRGLDYYTGTVFETIIPEHKEIGSIGGGGRYENLAGLYTDQVLPGVGGSIGLTRLFFIMNEYGLFSETDLYSYDRFAIIPISKNEYFYALTLAKKLREEGKIVDLVFSDKKLGDRIKYATKVAKFGIIVGDNEVESDSYSIKNFETGEVIPA